MGGLTLWSADDSPGMPFSSLCSKAGIAGTKQDLRENEDSNKRSAVRKTPGRSADSRPSKCSRLRRRTFEEPRGFEPLRHIHNLTVFTQAPANSSPKLSTL